ncbi:MAG: hypothetical protein QOG26_1118, partial [Solirubrobacterales bacterium]|nr:hypothetical protein [Solirubrobacterales bacterium]
MGGGAARGIKITAIARISTEYDDDPNNDDDFELIAVGTWPNGINGRVPPFLRYRDGRWSPDEPLARGFPVTNSEVSDVAFARPDDGWAVLLGTDDARLFHFDGQRWTACNPENVKIDRDACADHDQAAVLLPIHDHVAPLHLTIAGERIYLYGTRADQGRDDTHTSATAGTHHPFVLYKEPGKCKPDDKDGCWKASLNPKADDPHNPAQQGELYSLSVALGPDGSYNGWAHGLF